MKRVHILKSLLGYSSNETFKRFIDTINLRRVSKKIQNTRNLNYKYDATRENLPRNSRNARLITLIVKPFNRKTRFSLIYYHGRPSSIPRVVSMHALRGTHVRLLSLRGIRGRRALRKIGPTVMARTTAQRWITMMTVAIIEI